MQRKSTSSPSRRTPVKGHPGIYYRKAAGGKRRYEVCYRDSEKRLRWKVAGDRLEDAEALREELRGRKRKGQPLPARDTRTFSEYADAWLDGQPNLAPRTREDYELRFERVRPYLGHLHVQDVDVGALRLTIRKLSEKYAKVTAHNTLTPVRACLSDAVRAGLIAFNPFGLLDSRREIPKAGKRQHRILSEEEIPRLIRAATSTRYRVLLATYLFAGLRLMEGLGLTWGDVDTKACVIRVQAQLSRKPGEGRVALKTQEASRGVVIPDALAAMLREYRAAAIFSADADYVFCTDTGKPLGWSNVVRYALGSAVKAAKLYSPQPRMHDLRHTFASMLIADGADVEFVRGQLGHTDAATTLRVYTHEFAASRSAANARAAMDARLGNSLETTHPVGSDENESVKVVPLADFQGSSEFAATG